MAGEMVQSASLLVLSGSLMVAVIVLYRFMRELVDLRKEIVTLLADLRASGIASTISIPPESRDGTTSQQSSEDVAARGR